MGIMRARGLLIGGGIAIGVVLAAIVATMGPSRAVVCGQGNALDQLAQNVMQPLGEGHIDSASASYCTVPTAVAWLLAVAAFILAVVVGTILAQRGTTTPQDSHLPGT